jgi:lipopolysaccharide assembly outer membrane protein LptD (OstA)
MKNQWVQRFLWSVLLSLWVLPIFEAFALDTPTVEQSPKPEDSTLVSELPKPEDSTLVSELPIKMNADKVNFDYQTGVGHFSENVNIECYGVKLFADKAIVYSRDKKVRASGHVWIMEENKIYCCDSIEYDFEVKKGTMVNGSTMENAWILTGDRVNQIAENRFIIENCRTSACGNAHPHFFMTANKVEVEAGKTLIAHNTVFWIGPIPIFYWPYYKERLDRRENFVNVRLGSSNLFGGYIFTRFHYPLSDHTDLYPHVNYYSKRGLGLGLNSKTITQKSWTRFRSFYIEDEKFVPTLSQEKPGDLVRTRLSLQNNTRLSDWNSSLDLNYLSDADLLNDYYKSESDNTVQLDHQYRLSKTTEFDSRGVYIRARSNDFDNVLERTPEFYYDLVPLEILDDSNIYFSSTNTLSFLKRRVVLGDEPDLFRGYTNNGLIYANKFFDWLSFNPETGLETIAYSKSVGESNLNDGGNELRWSPFFRTRFSTNLWKRVDTDQTFWSYTRFRHVLTPGIVYFYRPESNLKDAEIIQLDERDARGKKQEIVLDLISRWQAKKLNSVENNPFAIPQNPGEATTLFNTRYSIPYDLNANEDPWGNFAVESEWRPTNNFKTDVRLEYNFQNSTLPNFRTDLSWRFENIFGASLGYWYRDNVSTLITPELSLNLGDDWFMRVYGHYNDATQVFERKEIAFIKSLHCLDLGIRFYQREYLDEKGFFFTLSSKNATSSGIGYSE